MPIRMAATEQHRLTYGKDTERKKRYKCYVLIEGEMEATLYRLRGIAWRHGWVCLFGVKWATGVGSIAALDTSHT